MQLKVHVDYIIDKGWFYVLCMIKLAVLTLTWGYGSCGIIIFEV